MHVISSNFEGSVKNQAAVLLNSVPDSSIITWNELNSHNCDRLTFRSPAFLIASVSFPGKRPISKCLGISQEWSYKTKPNQPPQVMLDAQSCEMSSAASTGCSCSCSSRSTSTSRLSVFLRLSLFSSCIPAFNFSTSSIRLSSTLSSFLLIL